jgi:hypothetical protein
MNMSLGDYLRGPAYRKRVEELEAEVSRLQQRDANLVAIAKKFGAMKIQELQRLAAREVARVREARAAAQAAEAKVAALTAKLSQLNAQILVVEDALQLESFALYIPKFKMNASHEYKTRLEDIRAKQKELIKAGEAATGNFGWEVNGSNAEGRKLVKDMIKLVLRSFNNECDYCVDHVKFDNIEKSEQRIRDSFEACNRLGRIMSVQLAGDYLNLKLDELHLAHEFEVKKNDEKEQAKVERAELREQQQVERELRAAREKIAKEQRHFAIALRDLKTRLEQTSSEEDRAKIQMKIEEVSVGKATLEHSEKELDYREQHAKAGYVYVISNLGAFGSGVYKIGMTRRLDPMERIDELGDASVPFWFDVHAMVFSKDAPALEATLHERFAAGRVNKVNQRKEFFRAELTDIEAVIREQYDAVVEVIHEAPAEEYREGLKMGTDADLDRHV